MSLPIVNVAAKSLQMCLVCYRALGFVPRVGNHSFSFERDDPLLTRLKRLWMEPSASAIVELLQQWAPSPAVIELLSLSNLSYRYRINRD